MEEGGGGGGGRGGHSSRGGKIKNTLRDKHFIAKKRLYWEETKEERLNIKKNPRKFMRQKNLTPTKASPGEERKTLLSKGTRHGEGGGDSGIKGNKKKGKRK